MNDYFGSDQYREDYTNILKALLLMTKRIELISTEIRQLRIAQTTNLTNAPHLPSIFPDDQDL